MIQERNVRQELKTVLHGTEKGYDVDSGVAYAEKTVYLLSLFSNVGSRSQYHRGLQRAGTLTRPKTWVL